MKLSNGNPIRCPGVEIRESDWSRLVGFFILSYSAIRSHLGGFLDLKTLQSTEAPLVTSLAPSPHRPLTVSAQQSRHLLTQSKCLPHSRPTYNALLYGWLNSLRPLCMQALICPSTTLSHSPFPLKGSEAPVSNFSGYSSFLKHLPPRLL